MNNEKENELNNLEESIKSIENEQVQKRNEIFILREKKVKLLQEKCKENIGRCFVQLEHDKVINYCKIINIGRASIDIPTNQITFNEYHYPAIWFSYPYKNQRNPFRTEDLFSGAWNKGNDIIGELKGITYKEISNKEFMEKFNEVNTLWINNLNNI